MLRRSVLGILLVLVLLGVAQWSTGIGRSDGLADRTFDADIWRAGDRRVRGAMVQDLEARKLLLGMNKDRVIDLLGSPDASDTFGYTLEYAVDLGLRTGPWGLGGTWPFYTTVVFDGAQGEVNEVRTRD